ncbi:MAG: alanine racemase [Betaproteobacteria bacterium]|nr:alanine racemase [Betaproteobacteria bacterium]MBV9360110.1 alanine racemase [Betaproteobacteria bacterium]
MPRPIRAAISASALAHNLSVARKHAGNAKIWAVIKANAYGHGLERAARAMEAADGFAVLDFQEAARLRVAGVTKPILMLEGVFKPVDVPLLHKYALTPVIHSSAQVDMLRTAELGGPIDIYLKLNSGMNRLGFTPENLGGNYQALRENPRVRSITLMTHFADADGATGVKAQLEWFGEMTKSFPHKRSLANSAALLKFPEALGEWVRPGIMLYGCSPFADRPAGTFDLKPAMTLTSELIATQHLQSGERVGYGFSYEAAAELDIGIVACGYADGYPRHAPVGTPILVNGIRTRIVGRVSMDMITVDLSGIPDAGVGTPVTLWGEGLSADEVAAAAGTLSYEMLCALAPRVPVTDAP